MNDKNFKTKIERLKDMVAPEYKDTVDVIVPLHAYYINLMHEVKKVLEVEYELTKSELDLLTILSTTDENFGTLAPTELYDHLVFSSGGMTKLLKKLENKEYIIRIDNPEDKRSKLVQITFEGREIAKNAMNDVLKLETEYISKISVSEKTKLTTILKKLVLKEN